MFSKEPDRVYKKVKLAPMDDNDGGITRRSIQSAYSRAMEEHEKTHHDGSAALTKLISPKMSYINNILGQHLIHHEFNDAFKTFMEEMKLSGHNPDSRGVKSNAHLLKAEMFHAFRKGEEHRFFDLRESLFEQLNYYKKDFTHSIETEMKCRVFFAIYYLTSMNTRNSEYESLMSLTKKRMQHLKLFFGEHGSVFAKSDRLKGYLQIPYLKLSQATENQTLKYCLSDKFLNDLEIEIEAEVDSVIQFLSKNSRNKSFVVKIFEYYTNTNVKAEDMKMQIQQSLMENMEELKDHKQELEDENEKLKEYHQKLKAKYQKMKKKFLKMGQSGKKASGNLEVKVTEPIVVKRISEEQKKIDQENSNYFRELLQCAVDILELENSKVENKATLMKMSKLKLQIERHKIQRPVYLSDERFKEMQSEEKQRNKNDKKWSKHLEKVREAIENQYVVSDRDESEFITQVDGSDKRISDYKSDMYQEDEYDEFDQPAEDEDYEVDLDKNKPDLPEINETKKEHASGPEDDSGGYGGFDEFDGSGGDKVVNQNPGESDPDGGKARKAKDSSDITENSPTAMNEVGGKKEAESSQNKEEDGAGEAGKDKAPAPKVEDDEDF